MPLNMVGACQLHIPHKDWSPDPHEKANYEAIEQWSYRLPNCFSKGVTLAPSLTSSDNTVHTLLGNDAPRNVWTDSHYPRAHYGTGLTDDSGGIIGVLEDGILFWSIDVSYSLASSPTPNVGSQVMTTVRFDGGGPFFIDTRPMVPFGEEYYFTATVPFPASDPSTGRSTYVEVFIQQANSVGLSPDFYISTWFTLLPMPVPAMP